MLRIALIDDRRFFRAGLRAILEAQIKLSVVAEGMMRQTTCLIKATRPQLALLCLSTHNEAIHLLAELKQLAQSPAILIVAESISERGVRTLLTLGASGILLQEDASRHLPWAVLAATQGGCALAPEISRQVINEYTAPITELTQKRAAQAKIDALTVREQEVLALLSDGLSNQVIAQALTISPGTVKDHVRSICSKLNADSRFQAARIAWQATGSGAST